ncbi:MAG: DeoR/GlpR transcriptional regulator [Chloroflexi bacterium]|nr:DeoR/GlpR transcriptional regulator [Chloroflexota bacterium]
MTKKERSPEERAKVIIDHLIRHSEINGQELSEILSVSIATIRRDLEKLENEGLLRRIHSGAVLVESMIYEPFRLNSSFSQKEQKQAEEKRLIGLAASSLINDGEIIGLTPGTTNTQVARSIHHVQNVTVVTNAINLAMELVNRKEITVFVTGGYLGGNWFSLAGATTSTAINDFYFDKLFISVSGVHPEQGLSTAHPQEIPILRSYIAQAKQKILVADSSKLNQVSQGNICDLGEIDILITDQKADPALIEHYSSLGWEITFA